MADASASLAELVARLPEIYQPIYEHPELSAKTSRGSERLDDILALHAALAERLGRPVRVLDLGCAQGWISMHLARNGAVVHGIDHLQQNIDVCRAVASEHPDLATAFHQASIEQFAGELESGRFDLFLGLSVFHHLTHRFGKQWVKDLIAVFFQKIPNGILEIALSTEHPDWARSQPDDPSYFIEDVRLVSRLSDNKTHLSSSRPMYFCSDTFRFYGSRLYTPNCTPTSLVILIGTSGSGKSTVARMVAGVLRPFCHLDLEEKAFDRRFVENIREDDADLANRVIAHCKHVIDDFPALPTGATVIVDRWYENYILSARLSDDQVDEIERYIQAKGYRGFIFNLLIDDDVDAIAQHLEQMAKDRQEHFPGTNQDHFRDWARRDFQVQRDNRSFGQKTRLEYAEINTTGKEWERYVRQILDSLSSKPPEQVGATGTA